MLGAVSGTRVTWSGEEGGEEVVWCGWDVSKVSKRVSL